MVKLHNFIIYFLVTVILLSAGFVFWSVQNTNKGIQELTVTQAAETYPIDLSRSTKLDVGSPDGKYTLTMETKSNPDKSLTQDFYITHEKETQPVLIYSSKSSTDEFVTVPYNAFSPDNKYIFLKEENSSDDYIVLRTDGKSIREDEKVVRVIESFSKNYPDYIVSDVTGWGGVDLIVLNADSIDGKIGPSFWFELPNLGFIRLSNRFN